jgi:hypothetical protein
MRIIIRRTVRIRRVPVRVQPSTPRCFSSVSAHTRLPAGSRPGAVPGVATWAFVMPVHRLAVNDRFWVTRAEASRARDTPRMSGPKLVTET